CPVLGTDLSARPSVCEQPVSEGMLSYHDKYIGGGKSKGMQGSRRILPAPIGEELTKAVTEAAVRAFQAIGGAGVARVDFFVDQAKGSFYVNEVNTIPGSLAFYLWEAAGLKFPDLLEELLRLALDRHNERKQSMQSIPSWLLSHQLESGVKMGKGPKTG
ncbi:MAG: D-alanine--D-alanine ligase, partial [Candidatus Dormibacteraceae bacterium]